LRSGRTGFGVARERLHQFIEPGGFGDGVVIDDGDKIGWGLAGGEVKRGAETGVGSGVQHSDAFAGGVAGPVPIYAPFAAIVDNHYAEIPKCLPVQAFDAFP